MTTTIDNKQEAARFNSQKAITDPYDSGTKHDKKYREILHYAPEGQTEQDLYLKLKDTKYTWNTLFLGRSKVFDKDHSPERYNIVVPIVPRCYTTTNRDPAHAEPPPKGWIYIIRARKSTKGPMLVELWRELRSDGKGFFRDVHLEEVKKLEEKDHREATGKPGFRIIVPYCIDKVPHDLWIAFSEVQWSWARIQSMKKNATLRNRRMHKLDLSDCLNDFEKSDYKGPSTSSQSGSQRSKEKIKDVSGPALIYNLKTAPDPFSRMLTDDLKDPIPAVYLDNPVGIAKSLGMIYQKACDDMRNFVHLLEIAPGVLQGGPPTGGAAQQNTSQKGTASQGPPDKKRLLQLLNAKPYDPVRWFDSAVVLNRYLYTDFPNKAPEDWTKEQKAEFPKLKSEVEEKFLNYRGKIDKADLDKALYTERRNELRRTIEITKGWLTDFLHHELVTLGEDSALLQALDDHFTLSVKVQVPVAANLKRGANIPWIRLDFYDHGWKAVAEIIRYLGKHIYAHDENLITPAPDGWGLRKKDAGMKLLEKIADPQGGLLIHARLFPKGKDDHPTEVDRTAPVEDHAPEFKAKHFDSLTGAPFAQCMDTITKFAREFEEVVAMDDRGDSAYREAVNRVKYSITRLINGVTDAELDHYLVPIIDVLAFKQDVLEGPQDESREDYQTLRRPALAFGGVGDAYFEDVNATLKNKAATEITSHVKHDANSRKITGYTTPKGCDYKVKRATLRKAGDANNLTDMTVTTKFGDKIDLTPKISGPKLPKSYLIESEVVMGLSRKARERLLERIGSNEQNMKALGGLVAVVETVNLVNSLQAVMNNKNDDLRGELFADLISSFGDLAGAMENLIDDGAKAVVDDVGKGALKRLGAIDDIADQAKLARKIQVLRIMAHVGSAIDIGVTLKSLIENFRQNDDAYIGDSVMLAGFALTAVGATAAAAPLAALVGLSAAWVTGIGLLLLLIGYLLKRFVFPEDTSFVIWLANGPFACGKHTHPHFSYRREEEIIYFKDSGGQSVPKACTVHHYGPSKLIVDSDGNLVDGTFSDMHVNNKTKAYIFKCDQKGQVYLKAGRHPDIKTDTFIGALGEPYTPHPVLQTGTNPGDERFDGHTPGKDPGQRVCMNPFDPLGIVLQDLTGAKKRHRFAIWCEMPKEAYRALMDALYRPVVTSRTMRLKTGVEEVWLHIHMPFLLPKSEVYLEFWAQKTVREWGGEKTLPAIEYTLDSKTCGGHQPTLKEKEEKNKELEIRRKDPYGLALNSPHALLASHPMEHPSTLKELADGPNRFTIRLKNDHYLECRVKVRIDLYGDQETCLPWEPVFCGGDISTDKGGHRWLKVEKAFLFNPNR